MRISLTILAIAVASVMGVGSQLYISGRAQSSPPDLGGKPIDAAPDQIAANGVVEGIHPEADLRLDTTGICCPSPMSRIGRSSGSYGLA